MTPTPWPIPSEPLDLDGVLRTYPTIRQSVLAKFDDCPLSAYFEMRYSSGWSTHPMARGTMFHRVAAECIREMQRQDSTTIPVGTALAILEELLEQRDVEPIDRIRIPLRDVKELRWSVSKWARDNTFSIRQIVDVEQRIAQPIEYRDDAGELRKRILTGQLDLLVADPEDVDGAVVIDWKDTWGVPPNHNPNPDRSGPEGMSYHGYFQQRFYAWLVMKEYPSVNRVTLREFYPRRTEARRASIIRNDLERVEQEIAVGVMELDRCLASGKPERLHFPEVAPWNPQPGKHCHWCVSRMRCPIEDDVLAENFAVRSEADARKWAATLEVLEGARKAIREALRPWCEENGPIYVRWSKGRRVLGLRTPKTGGSPALTFFSPEGSDRPTAREPVDAQLEAALKRSVEVARAERDADSA